jgi:hypothetical protein
VKVAAVAGIFLNFAPGLYAMVVSFVVGPSIVIEYFGITGSLKRSYNSVSGNCCFVFSTMAIVYLIMIVGQILWDFIAAGDEDPVRTFCTLEVT